jgi:hypothetical protein
MAQCRLMLHNTSNRLAVALSSDLTSCPFASWGLVATATALLLSLSPLIVLQSLIEGWRQNRNTQCREEGVEILCGNHE